MVAQNPIPAASDEQRRAEIRQRVIAALLERLPIGEAAGFQFRYFRDRAEAAPFLRTIGSTNPNAPTGTYVWVSSEGHVNGMILRETAQAYLEREFGRVERNEMMMVGMLCAVSLQHSGLGATMVNPDVIETACAVIPCTPEQRARYVSMVRSISCGNHFQYRLV